MPECKTYVVIIKFKNGQEIKRAPVSGVPFFRENRSMQTRGQPKIPFMETQMIDLTKPILIVPNGQTDSVEVIPITDPTIIHSRNYKRELG